MYKCQAILFSLVGGALPTNCIDSTLSPLQESGENSTSLEAESSSTSDDSNASDSDSDTTSSIPSEIPNAFPPRPDHQSCRFDGLPPGALPSIDVADWIENLPIDMAVRARPSPTNTESMWIASARGQIARIQAHKRDETVDLSSAKRINKAKQSLRSRASETVLDIQSRVGCCEDRGLMDFAIRPTSADGSGQSTETELFVLYRGTSISQGFSRLSRFIVPVDGQADSNQEQILFEVSLDQGSPLGGWLSFGSDSMLYIALGAGQDSEKAQDPSSRLGKLLRIDISSIDKTGTYSTPTNNPFAGASDAVARETWALGLRDPWRCSFDPLDASLWCGDAGLTRDEINKIEAGNNYGWPLAEGKDCLVSPTACQQLSLSSPSWVHLRQSDDCGITGGVVYRGIQQPLLNSAYLYSDRCSGRVYAWTQDQNQQIKHHGEIGRWKHGVTSFTIDLKNEPFVVGDHSPKLARPQTINDPATFPIMLSQSDCYNDIDNLQTSLDLFPYELNAPLWSDASSKFRHLMIPPQRFIAVSDDGSWSFPEGTLLLKTFAFTTDAQTQSLRPVETRVMKLERTGWKFFTYAWNDQGTDAVFQTQARDLQLTIVANGEILPLSYHLPSEYECRVCHGFAASSSLGPSIGQLHRKVELGGHLYDQLAEMDAIKLFSNPLSPQLLTAPAMPAPNDPDQTIEARARAYLHANCSHCHRPGGWVPPLMDLNLQASTPLAESRSCEVEPQYDLWTQADYRIDPGASDNSALWLRMDQQGFGRMPPLATQLIDPQAIVVKQWIDQMASCPERL